MKKYLSLLLTLFSLATFAQNSTYYAQATIDGKVRWIKVRRDLAVYPRTTEGTTAINAAIVSKALSISVLTPGSGKPATWPVARIIAAVTQPGCTNCSGPSWLSARYTYVGNKLQVRGDPVGFEGNGVTMSVNRKDGVGMQLSNDQNPVLNSGTQYSYGLVGDAQGFVLDWTFSGVPQVPLLLKFNRPGQPEYVKEFTPQSTATAIALFNAPGSSTVTTPPSSTTSAPVCTTCSAGGNVTLLTYTNQAWGGSDLKFIENDSIKVGFRYSVGGSICWISMKYGPFAGQNMINAVVKENGIIDKGREMQTALYATPARGYIQNGKNTATAGFSFDTGLDPVQGGSSGPWFDPSIILSSAIVSTGDRGAVFCVKVRPMIWGVQNEPAPFIFEKEIWLVGNRAIVGQKLRVTVEDRPAGSSQPQYSALEQEEDCIYTVAPMTDHKTVIGAPGVNGPTVDRFPQNWATDRFSPTYYSSENWVGSYLPGGGVGITAYSKDDAAVRTGQFTGTEGSAEDEASSYIKLAPQMNYDNPGVYSSEMYVIAGTMTQARWAINNVLPGRNQSFNFDFSQDNHRWFNTNCKGYKRAGFWEYTIGDLNQDGGHFGQFCSPARSWNANTLTKVQFDMAVSGGVTRLWFEYKKPGGYDGDSNNNRVAISVIPDGVRRIYTVQTSSLPNWTGGANVISRVALKAIRNAEAPSEPETPNSANIKVYRIGSNLN